MRVRAYKKDGRAICSLDGCSQPLYCRGLCTTHYTRLLRKGDVGSAARIRSTWGAGSVNEDGYVVLHDPSHPLAVAQGKVLQHRAVLFDAIGPGTHGCHWCSKELTWSGHAATRINVDHLDHNRQNNALSNLVPSCLDCNTKRRAA